MTITIKTVVEAKASKEAFVTVYKPIAGWKAVLFTWDDEFNCHTPAQTGYFGYPTKAEAESEAKHWADCEDIAYVPSHKKDE